MCDKRCNSKSQFRARMYAQQTARENSSLPSCVCVCEKYLQYSTFDTFKRIELERVEMILKSVTFVQRHARLLPRDQHIFHSRRYFKQTQRNDYAYLNRKQQIQVCVRCKELVGTDIYRNLVYFMQTKVVDLSSQILIVIIHTIEDLVHLISTLYSTFVATKLSHKTKETLYTR